MPGIILRSAPPNNRIQATAGGLDGAGSRAGCSPAAPDAERYAQHMKGGAK
jgi:hypothetical protein